MRGGGGNIYIICTNCIILVPPAWVSKTSEKLCMGLACILQGLVTTRTTLHGISYGFHYSFTSVYGASNITMLRTLITLPRSKCCSTTLHGISLTPLTMRKLEKEKRKEGLVNGYTTSCSSAGMLVLLLILRLFLASMIAVPQQR